jgi:hypothetical protein
MIEAPFSELDYSSDYLDEFHGFLEDDEQPMNEEDAQIYGAISPNSDGDYQDGLPLVNRAGEPIMDTPIDEEEVKESFRPQIREEEEEKGYGLQQLPLRAV